MSTTLLAGAAASQISLPVGTYFRNGTTPVDAIPGNWTPTTLQGDGSAGDQTTGDTSNGAGIMILHVRAATSLGAWDQTLAYKGNLTQSFKGGTSPTASSWSNLTDTNAAAWGAHALSYQFERRTATFSDSGSLVYIVSIQSESDTSGGNIQSSDSRPTA